MAAAAGRAVERVYKSTSINGIGWDVGGRVVAAIGFRV